MPILSQLFPDLYKNLLPDLMGQTVPQESKADCANCTMSRKDPLLGAGQKHLFRADTKCCTFHPKIPNYLLGGLLSDSRPELAEGQRRIRQRIVDRQGVTPWWIGPTVLDQHLYDAAKSSFGKARRLRCPYFAEDSGNCTVWAYREAVCSTWYCKYEAGQDGLNFWSSTKRAMALVEKQLARYAMLQIDADMVFDDAAAAFYGREQLLAEDLDAEAPDEGIYARLWRGFEGMEEEFYIRCYELVKALRPEDLTRLLGLDGEIKEGEFKRKLAAASSEELPQRLAFNPKTMIQWLEGGEVALAAYSEYDALALPGAVYPLLVAFDGRSTTAETRARLRSQYQADIGDDILLTLYRHRILEAR